ncbi:hypothetical protein WJR50_33340 [Catalinimonas sp. 4WD22]|uniref:hypothetical protein n=1 Tax=Catalinimonas locisalis TaxID=3133978 RepID=UPI00310143F8
MKLLRFSFHILPRTESKEIKSTTSAVPLDYEWTVSIAAAYLPAKNPDSDPKIQEK